MIGLVIALVALHLAAGGLALTAFLALKNRSLPDGYLRFCCLAVTVSALFAALVGPRPIQIAAALVLAAALGWYLGLRRGFPAPPLAAAAAALSIAALVVECALASPVTPIAKPLCLAGALSSALLLGAVSASMVLGHWYLVAPGLAITPLKHGALWLWFSVTARWAAVGLVLIFGGWETLRLVRPSDVIFSTTGLFFFIRALVGLAAPLLLAGLIWQTVKMRSTQSATGLLYVAVILVLFGELVSQFLTVTTGMPW